MSTVLDDVDNIVFGHWAALNGVTNRFIKGVDLGCVWGGSLAAINLNDKSIITVESITQKSIKLEDQ